ncbi:hypothetical protein HY68_12620 [Streptomyces sp. AcH 505]|uniref:hypothetical protein n=1 Tax=Streptomyces sp. AcH 505 TaxID=352211 RepID=UPI000591869E|nr:hypothetical protein HY68_12620 [Streptomyces sp. AcH 505]
MSDEPQTDDPMVAALLRERAGYATRGMDERVAQVDEQLKLRGHAPSASPTPGPSTGDARSAAPKSRQPRRTEKT